MVYVLHFDRGSGSRHVNGNDLHVLGCTACYGYGSGLDHLQPIVDRDMHKIASGISIEIGLGMEQATQPLKVPMLHAIQVALSLLRTLLHIRWTLTHDGISLLSGQV